MKKKVVPKLRQEMKVKVDIVTSDDIKIYYTGKFQDFTNLRADLSFVTLTIHLCNGLNDKNLVKPRKTCFITVKLFHVLHNKVETENMILDTLEMHSN